MSKLKPLPRKTVIGILASNDFQQIRSGKHITFKRTTADGRVLTTWVPQHREIS